MANYASFEIMAEDECDGDVCAATTIFGVAHEQPSKQGAQCPPLLARTIEQRATNPPL